MQTYHIHINGIVQGVGFRPMVYQLATEMRLNGSVKNGSDGVHVFFNAEEQEAHSFFKKIKQSAPQLSKIIFSGLRKLDDIDFKDFSIIVEEKDNYKKQVLIAADAAICETCRAELHDATNRRYRYPFVTCTQCGPRYSIMQSIPLNNYQAADKVIGKNNFDEKDYDPSHAVWPYSVKVSEDGVLAITDTQYYRVLLWNDWKDAFTKTAEVIIGQPDLESCGQNQYRLRPQANTLNWCYDMFIQDGSLWLVDTGNSRILFFKNIPSENNEAADELFGNNNFETIGEHLDVGKQDSERLYWPFAITLTTDKLIVADTGNHRIVIYSI